jgi:hypothetical protein
MLVKAKVYFAALLAPVLGCAYGVDPEEIPKPDAGEHPMEAGNKPDVATTPDVSVPDVQNIPDVSQPTCSSLPLPTGDPVCDSCLGASCCSQDQACGNDNDCLSFINCEDNCIPLDGGPLDPTCESACETSYPTGANELNLLESCMSSLCRNDCGM